MRRRATFAHPRHFSKRIATASSASSLNRFQIMTGTRFHRSLEKDLAASSNGSAKHPGITRLTVNYELAQLNHRASMNDDAEYRCAVRSLITAAHHVNRRELLPAAARSKA